MTTVFDIDEARTRWPADVADLPADAQSVYAAWLNASPNDRKSALQRVVGFTAPDAPYRKWDKCRDLVLLRSPFPTRVRGVSILTEDSVALIGATRDVDEDESDIDDEASSVADQLAALRRETAGLKQTIANQAGTIQQLFNSQSAEEGTRDGDYASSYEVVDDVFEKLGLQDDGVCSWMDILPLSVKDRKMMAREHCGTYSCYPADLDMMETTKLRPEVKKANLSLQTFASQEIARYMLRNNATIKMAGTAYSRVVEMRRKLQQCLTGTDDEDVVPISDVVSFLEVLEGTSSSTLELAVDVQTHLRLAVSRRIETALGVSHLRQDPLKKKKVDFIPPDTYALIADAAQKKEDLSWAQSRLDTLKGSSFQGSSSHKSTGRGNKRGPFAQYKQQKGSGGRGRGGGGSHTKKQSPKADAPAKKDGGKGKGKGKKGD
jgi:hypothetical protein